MLSSSILYNLSSFTLEKMIYHTIHPNLKPLVIMMYPQNIKELYLKIYCEADKLELNELKNIFQIINEKIIKAFYPMYKGNASILAVKFLNTQDN